jgi:hypothetical protein
MAHWAKVNEENIVENVIVIDNSVEDVETFIREDLGFEGTWVQTSYNTQEGVHLLGGTPFRKNYSVIGGIWDPERDAFYSQKPWPSWVLNEEKCCWEPVSGNPDNKSPMQCDVENQTWLF